MNAPSKKTVSFLQKYLPFTLVFITILITIMVLGVFIAAKKADVAKRQSEQMAEQKPLTNVVTLEVVPGMIQEKISLPGVVTPWVSLEVVSEIRGKIVQRNAQEGRQVRKGDILATIDKRDYQNAFDSALASWETAVANQKRLAALVKNNFVTQSQLDDADAAVKTTRAAMENARLNLDRCQIQSPMDGIIDRVHIENGTYLNVGDPVCQLLQIDTLKVTVGIPESDVDAVRSLSTFKMTIDALDKAVYTGQYHYLYSTADSLAQLYTLEIKVENPDHRILPDMFARVEIIKRQAPQGLAVPIYSLVGQENAQGVFVENQGTVEFRPVKKGFQDGWNVQITQGLFPGDHVVVVGHLHIEDRERVNVIRTLKTMEELYQ